MPTEGLCFPGRKPGLSRNSVRTDAKAWRASGRTGRPRPQGRPGRRRRSLELALRQAGPVRRSPRWWKTRSPILVISSSLPHCPFGFII